MISNRPYMIRALFDWIVDNDWTPHLQVDAHYPGIEVPMEFAQDGMIVLNAHPNAVRELMMANDWFSFKARFSGVERRLGFPPEAVLAIFARENGQGMPFPPEPYPQASDEGSSKPPKPSKPTVSAVKDSGVSHAAADKTADKTAQKTDKDDKSKKPKKGSHLSVVK